MRIPKPTVQELRPIIVQSLLGSLHKKPHFNYISYSTDSEIDEFFDENTDKGYYDEVVMNVIIFDANKIALASKLYCIPINPDEDELFNLMLVLSENDYEKIIIATEVKSIEPNFNGVLFCNYNTLKEYALQQWYKIYE